MNHIPRLRRRTRPDFSLAVVNIIFLLLLFYLATGSLIKPSELETEAPVTRDLPLELLPRPLLLVAADGSLRLDGVPVTQGALAETARQSGAELAVLNVLADRAMAGRDFLDVLARLDTGGVPLRIVTLRERAGATDDPP